MLLPSVPSLNFNVLSSGIKRRAKMYSEVSDRLGFLCNLKEMEVMEPREMRQAAEKYVETLLIG